MFNEMIQAVIRHAVSGAAGVLVAHGLATNDQAQQLASGILAALAIYMTYQHKKAMLGSQSSISQQ
jgi:hypothetical protein